MCNCKDEWNLWHKSNIFSWREQTCYAKTLANMFRHCRGSISYNLLGSFYDSQVLWWNLFVFISFCMSTHCGLVVPYGIKIVIIGSSYGLVSSQNRAITWTSDNKFLIRHLKTSSNEILLKIWPLSFKNMHFKMSAILLRPRWVKTILCDT